MKSEQYALTSELAQTVAERFGVELYHVELDYHTLRVLIDSPGGPTLDVCSRFSRALSAELDTLDAIPGRYRLEVSSPGVERQLYHPRHFASAVGRRVLLKTRDQTFEAVLESADADALVVTPCEPPGQEPRTLRYEEITSARLKVADAELFAKEPRPEPSLVDQTPSRPAHQASSSQHQQSGGQNPGT